MAFKLYLFFAMSLTLATSQRPQFAGSRPIGYPEVYNRTTTTAEGLGNRFGEENATTQRLPIEANGDRELVDRLSKLPVDKQPFWFINWQALEANRNQPQTYPQKPNTFIDQIAPSSNTGNSAVNTEQSNRRGDSNSNNRPFSSVDTNSNSELANRFSGPDFNSNVMRPSTGISNKPVNSNKNYRPGTYSEYSTYKVNRPRTPVID